MKLAGAQAIKFCASPAKGIWAFLIFGDDEGVISDTAATLRKALSPAGIETETITLDEDAIRRDPAMLTEALEARSLLGNNRIIRVRTNGDKIANLLLETIALGETTPDRYEAKLIITAGPLAKRSRLRATIETAKAATALHVFADEAADVATLARDTLNQNNVAIDEDALSTFAAELPGHRGLANQEIAKLSLYGYELGRPISLADIRALSTTDIDHSLHELISATLGGRTSEAQANLDRLLIAGTSPISILRALQRETMRLAQAHTLAGSGGDIGMKLRPPVFRNMWPAFRATMSLWPPKRLSRIIERIYDAEAAIKRAGPTGEPIIRQLLGELCDVAAKSLSRV